MMGNCHLHKIEFFHTLGTPESERLKVTALNLWEASYLSFDRPLPGKPPKIPDHLSPFSKSRFFHITTQPPGERVLSGKQIGMFLCN
jgi:hypothetical protein